MVEKKLFPGVLAKQLEEKITKEQNQQFAAEKKRIALEKAQQYAENKLKNEKEQSKLHDLYNHIMPLRLKIGIIAMINFCLGGLYTFGESEANYEKGTPDTPFGSVILETYIPNYSYEITDEGIDKQKGEGKFISGINERWFWHTLVLLSEAIILAFVAKHNAKRNKQIDLMAEIAKTSKDHNIDPSYIKKLIKVAPDIVENMSKDSRVYFDMLMEGKFDLDKTPGIFDITTNIMMGHLKSHPEDMSKVLEVFDERSIPDQIKEVVKNLKTTNR